MGIKQRLVDSSSHSNDNRCSDADEKTWLQRRLVGIAPGVQRGRERNLTESDANSSNGDGPLANDHLEELFSAFQAPLERYFMKRVRDKAEVDDLVQEVFYRLAARRENTPMEKPEAYIFQIAANLLRDRARKEITKRVSTRQLFDQNENNFEEISPERVLLGRQKLIALKNALNELPERTRVIVLLHRYEEFKYREIALHLGISVSSVEKHMMDAIKHLTFRLGGPE